MYDYMVEELLKDNSFKLVRNILQELKKENFSIFDKNNKLGNKSQLNNLINKETLNLDNEESKNLYTAKEMVEVPIVGKITAGAPILAVENISDTFPIPIDEVYSLPVVYISFLIRYRYNLLGICILLPF